MNAFIDYFQKEYIYILSKWGEHLLITLAALGMATTLSLVMSVIATRPGRERLQSIIVAVAGAMQSVPSIAVIALAFLLMGIGMAPAIIALAIYCTVPVLFNTVSAIISIDGKMIDAALGMGMTRNQILLKVEVPLALPPIIAGIRSAAVVAVGTATIATAIGAGGLGEIIFIGLKMFDNATILAGALPVSLTAILLDLLFGLLGRVIESPGLRFHK